MYFDSYASNSDNMESEPNVRKVKARVAYTNHCYLLHNHYFNPTVDGYFIKGMNASITNLCL